MDIQRLRNLTTGRLHTEVGHIYQDIELLVGEQGVMTHMLGNCCRALEPYLRQVAPDPRLWDGAYDPGHTGTIEVPAMNAQQQSEFWARFQALPSPLARFS
jgi:hypothetical protein